LPSGLIAGIVDLGFDVVAIYVSYWGHCLTISSLIYVVIAIIHVKRAGLRQFLAKVFFRLLAI
jgi:hypothetical protein